MFTSIAVNVIFIVMRLNLSFGTITEPQMGRMTGFGQILRFRALLENGYFTGTHRARKIPSAGGNGGAR